MNDLNAYTDSAMHADAQLSASGYLERIGALPKESAQGSGRTGSMYVLGFVLSLALTFGAYWLALDHALSAAQVTIGISAIAIIQFAVQMACFLHLGTRKSSRDRLAILAWAGMIVLIVVSGSIWIMASLNSRMMPSQGQMMQYMDSQTGI